MTEQSSRRTPCCEALEGTHEQSVIEAIIHLFRDHGLSAAIPSGDCLPCQSEQHLQSVELSVFGLRLGITDERIQYVRSQQNDRHDHMHRTWTEEPSRPPGMDVLQQQDRFDNFAHEFNEARRHEPWAR